MFNLNSYNINIQELSSNYLLLCYNLYNIIKNNESNDKIKLYKEKWFKQNEKSMASVNDNDETILFHYFEFKIIPE